MGRWRVHLVAFATALSASVVLHGTASAQDLPPSPEPAPTAETSAEQALWLARLCVHEAGFHSPDDCRAIWRVLERGARRHRTTPIGFARRYSRTIFDTTRSDPRGWITRLDATGEEPAGFPTEVEHEVDGRRLTHRHPPWASFREDWLRTLAVCQRIVNGELRARCRAPDDWGGAMDAERAARLGLIPIPCGTTHNTFYARPQRSRPAARRVQIVP
ncbi:MAG: hypothetical protein J0L92_10820 [Deltaproteobacteria bacterium]|nr:hypothetical protein [Deltaproteobacteria bacterium]